MELTDIKGIGPKTANLFNKLEIFNEQDLIRFYPYRYNIICPSNIIESNEQDNIVITGIITSEPKVSYIKRNFNRLTFTLETSNIIVNVVIFNRAFLKPNLRVGKGITLIGKYNKLKNQFVASDIRLKLIRSTEVEPVYHTVSGLSSSIIGKTIGSLLSQKELVKEIVPQELSEQYNLMNTYDAIKEIHNPTDLTRLKQAKLKLKYEELFEFMFKINLIRYKNQIFDDFVIKHISQEDVNEIIDLIPFDLTNDQRLAINDIVADFNKEKRMNRLILGDVGSGKTIVAFISVLLNLKCGYQSAILAPTEVLAHQHYENFNSLFKEYNINVGLLVGSMKKVEKSEVINKLKNGEIDLLIGTHAMLEDNVEFNNIGLVITDEQHRFGVNQRKTLQNKGRFVDVLYMSATPIPRTYALTIYGDMDISMIKEKPKGRKDIKTSIYSFKDIKSVVQSIEEEINKGYQAYVVTSLIESEEEDNELKDLKSIEQLITSNFNISHKVGILHGKMKQIDKDKIMNEFKDGNLDVLISTTVIEVGVDVKNATVMAIFNAERFGLATLHQLRGRVGRNSVDSKCLLISNKSTERLNALVETNDGFEIAEKDFNLRGSGDLFGIRQSGDMVFKIADLRTDFKILTQCKKDSEEFILNNIENGFMNYVYYRSILNILMNND